MESAAAKKCDFRVDQKIASHVFSVGCGFRTCDDEMNQNIELARASALPEEGAPGTEGQAKKCQTLFHVGVPQEFGPPFFIFLAGDLPRGISPLQELKRRLHLPVGGPSHWHHEGKE